METKHLVVVGNGMAGMACLDQILRRKPNFKITVLTEELHYNYNRMLLSAVLSGEKSVEEIYVNTKEWYDHHDIRLCRGVRAAHIDSKEKLVFSADGSSISYDLLLLATGSNPFIPPIEGVNRKGIFTFRNLEDTEKILEHCKTAKEAVVIGGGLLGLEAARGIHHRGVKVTVVHLMDRLMEMQLDATGGEFLKREIEKLGITILLNKNTTQIMGRDHVEGVMFKDGQIVPADMVVIACGIRPNVELAKRAGLQVKRGIVVNDFLETSDPSIFAVGECVEHRGKVYGLVAPLYDQGRVLAATITGDKGPIYEGSVPATKLKVMGIELFSGGDFTTAEPNKEAIVYQDHTFGIYKKVVIERERVVGAILIGDASDANRLIELIRKQEPITEIRHQLLFHKPLAAGGSPKDVLSRPDSDTICGCTGVTKGEILAAIRKNGLKTLSQVKSCTKASTGCGSCAGLVQDLLIAVVGSEFHEEKKEVLCACVPFAKTQLRQMIQTQNLRSVQDILDIYGNGAGCSFCKPALSFLVDEVWLGEHKEDRSARFINDRIHANIQKDGTFSVVPRMRGGVTTPGELRKIAEVAEKYKVRMVKVTGSQRLDLLGVKKEDLPGIWADLGMTSGFAYAKAVRMVKSCVGSEFCRFGTQNSIETAIELETLLEGLYTPAKLKMAVVGCPRNCAEATVKDIGLVGVEGGWQVVIGGAAGKKVRAADVLVTVKTTKEALEAARLFFQYYREEGEYGERTYDFVERLGFEKIRRQTILASEESKKNLLERLQKARAKARNPWALEKGGALPPMQFRDLVVPQNCETLAERV